MTDDDAYELHREREAEAGRRRPSTRGWMTAAERALRVAVGKLDGDHWMRRVVNEVGPR